VEKVLSLEQERRSSFNLDAVKAEFILSWNPFLFPFEME